jgi:hypothetical protein
MDTNNHQLWPSLMRLEAAPHHYQTTIGLVYCSNILRVKVDLPFEYEKNKNKKVVILYCGVKSPST